jgi:hypothetical protein
MCCHNRASRTSGPTAPRGLAGKFSSFLVLALTLLPGCAPALADTLDGQILQVIQDDFDSGSATTRYYLDSTAGFFELILPSADYASGIPSGSRVQVDGSVKGSRFVVEDPAALSLTRPDRHSSLRLVSSAASVTKTAGVRRVAYFLSHLSV